jgi:hypothetical protein
VRYILPHINYFSTSGLVSNTAALDGLNSGYWLRLPRTGDVRQLVLLLATTRAFPAAAGKYSSVRFAWFDGYLQKVSRADSELGLHWGFV